MPDFPQQCTTTSISRSPNNILVKRHADACQKCSAGFDGKSGTSAQCGASKMLNSKQACRSSCRTRAASFLLSESRLAQPHGNHYAHSLTGAVVFLKIHNRGDGGRSCFKLKRLLFTLLARCAQWFHHTTSQDQWDHYFAAQPSIIALKYNYFQLQQPQFCDWVSHY